MIYLHEIDISKIETRDKVIIAIDICFSFKNIFQTSILNIVLQQLLEIRPIPLLIMRTMIQSFITYNDMIPLVLGLLSKLIKVNFLKNY
jgi:symplekin